MLTLIRQQLDSKVSRMKGQLRWNILLGDLSFFMALTVARFIIWRTLRRRRQERTARRKRFKLIHGSDHQAHQRVITS
jgi:ABC-type nickel/cobalt efflux system permease component RcnA